MYNDAVEHKRGSFTPIIATCEGILDREAEAYVKRLAFHLSKKWDKNNSQIVFWMRARFQRNIKDGAGIPYIPEE